MGPGFHRGDELAANFFTRSFAGMKNNMLIFRDSFWVSLRVTIGRLAEALAKRDEHRPALAAVRQGLTTQEERGQRRWEAELYRLEGLALVGLNRRDEAQSAFEQALCIARLQQAKSYELRAATSLAWLWGEQDRRAEARDLLAPVYGWFTESFDTADLKDAKTLLDQLA